jgi:hypothetical protein
LDLRRGGPTGGRRKLHNELYNLYSSPSIIKVIKSKMVSCTFKLKFAYWEVESEMGPLGMSATSSLFYLPPVIVRMENFAE